MNDPTWRPYDNYPNLKDAKIIAYDVETYDPKLLDKGPGAIRKDGYIIGFSLATDDGFCGYYPIRHEGGDNVQYPEKAKEWLRDQLSTDIPKVGANILYDLIWSKCDLGIDIKGKKYDVQIAEPLLDENRSSFRLDSLAFDYLGLHKDEQLLYQAGLNLLGIKATGKTKEEQYNNVIKKVKGKLWELPARYVGAYGEADAALPIDIFDLQKAELKKRDLWKLFDEIETPIVDLLLDMWLKGVPVDVEKGERAAEILKREYDQELRSMKKRVGVTPDIWSNESVEKAFKKLGIAYNMTDRGNASFDADFLAASDHDFCKMLLNARQLDRSGGVFIESKILDNEVNGRIHPQFWQVKNDLYGTGSGRFSSSNPNAQQFPSRVERLAKMVRGLLVPEPGYPWIKADYSQQEFRVLVHYATIMNLPGARTAQIAYQENIDTDYHQFVADITGLDRKAAKNLNLGLSYGMGAKKFSEKYNISISEAKKLYEQYHSGLPFIKQLTYRAQRMADQRGYVKTILGRHRHFDMFGPPWSMYKKGDKPYKYDEAVKKYGAGVQRWSTFRAWNAVCQGSAADMVKKAMVDCYKEGYVPAITVHDELDFIDIDRQEDIDRIHDIMVNAIPMEVPNKVDIEIGPNWGELEKTF